MRILILSNYANGIWLYRKELVQSFIDDGHEVYISVPPDENCEKLTKLGFTVIETKLDRHGLNPIKDMALFREYLKLIKKYRPGVVLTYTIKPNIYGASAARLKRVPYICNITGLGKAVQGGGLLSRVLVSMYRFSMGKARKVFFQNEGNMKILQKRGIAKKNAALLPGSGVNTTEHPLRDYPDESNGIIILAVLRMMKDKGVGEYLEAVEKLSDKLPNLKFELVGEYEEDERHIYEPMIEALVSKGILKYYGHIDNVEEVMSRCHVVVHPSYHEGMSNVLLEAAACGRPVLTSNIPGCREAVIEGKNGFLFRSESAEALISSIEKIASLSTEERKAMGLEGRKFIVENFDRDIIISRYRQELAKL